MHCVVVVQSKAMAKTRSWKDFVFAWWSGIVAFLMWYWLFFIEISEIGVTLNELKDLPVLRFMFCSLNSFYGLSTQF
ncbi:hypothetical protein M3Y98_01142400 [Aphelenchoides besseyi]|nr:hypothetical protein M3Y98_01142400 [Aphelenchoides besseyi]KAI6210697.1 hypothetical protein M3Y96_00355400 [Aphelenchoides besseyi]